MQSLEDFQPLSVDAQPPITVVGRFSCINSSKKVPVYVEAEIAMVVISIVKIIMKDQLLATTSHEIDEIERA